MPVTRERFKVWGNVFDEFTERTLFKLITEGHFDGMQSPISIGKESNVFSAKRGAGKVIVKIYRLESCDFNKMYDYIKYDPRFQNLKKRKRQVVLSWVQREYRNLLKARESGVRVPMPITYKNNVLVIEFIGSENVAPKLKDKAPENPKKFLEEVIRGMRDLFRAGMVHADLSSFNILNDSEKPVFIDVSQCSSIKHPRAQEFFDRDVRNIATYFRKIGLKADEDQMKKRIMGP